MKIKHSVSKIKHSVSSPLPQKKSMGGFFSLKEAFHGETDFLGQIYGGLIYMGSNDQIMQWGGKRFTNVFSSNLNSVNLKIFSSHGGRHTWK